jgi:carboxylesterase type B
VKTYWTTFVTTHDPNPAGAGLPTWPAWSAPSPNAMTFADGAAVAPLEANAHCAFWDFLLGGS